MWSGFDFQFSDFALWLTRFLSWSTMMWLIAVGFVFVLVSDVAGLLGDIVRILFGSGNKLEGGGAESMIVSVGGSAQHVGSGGYGSLLDSMGLQDIGVRKASHTLVATDEDGVVLVTGQAEFFERVHKAK